MTNVKVNFSKMYEDVICDLCKQNLIQNDSHLFECETIIDNCPELANDIETEYEDLFNSIQSQKKAVKLFMAIFKTKQGIEDEKEGENENS